MVVLSILVFSLALVASVAAIAATVAPRWAQIVDLLRYGPVVEPVAVRVAARRPARAVAVRVQGRPVPQQRAAA